MARTASKRTRTTRSKPRAKQERIRVEDGIEDTMDWTPAELRVHPRRTQVEIWEKAKRVAEASIAEWGGEEEGKIEGTVHVAVNTSTEREACHADMCDVVTFRQVDLIIEALLVARERARAIGILPRSGPEIVTEEVPFDDTKAGGPRGRFIRMTADVDGREFTAELYDPFTGSPDRRFLSLCATPKQGEESNIGLYLTPAQIEALAGIFASVRDKAAR